MLRSNEFYGKEPDDKLDMFLQNCEDDNVILYNVNAKQFSKILDYFSSIKVFDLSIETDSELNMLNEKISNTKYLEKLEINNEIKGVGSEEKIKSFFNNLFLKNKSIKVLIINECSSFSDDCLKEIDKSNIKTFQADFCNITDVGCKYLSKSCSIKYLFLNNNFIGDEGCQFLSKVKNLDMLEIQRNNITNIGYEMLSQLNLSRLEAADNINISESKKFKIR